MGGPMWMPTAPPTLARLIEWHPQPVPLLPLLAIILLIGYLIGVGLLHQRGDHWPAGRTIAWVLGIASVLAVTATGVDGYGMELFSVHMVQHMALSMGSPLLLVLGAPVTLALRALPARSASHWNARKLLLAVLHSRAARVLTHPAVTVTLFLASLYALYFTPVFDALMATWWGHNLMLVHFLVIGALYFWNIIGIDPSPRSHRTRAVPVPVARIFEVAITIPFHAFFGIVIMMSVSLVVGFYREPLWAIVPLQDQALGGGIAWGFTEIPTLAVLAALFSQWQKSETRHARQRDRKADGDNEAELTEYNRRLADLTAHNERRGRATTPE